MILCDAFGLPTAKMCEQARWDRNRRLAFACFSLSFSVPVKDTRSRSTNDLPSPLCGDAVAIARARVPEPGVGKTAIVAGLALRIVNGDVPEGETEAHRPIV
jgi:hypothetical protein